MTTRTTTSTNDDECAGRIALLASWKRAARSQENEVIRVRIVTRMHICSKYNIQLC